MVIILILLKMDIMGNKVSGTQKIKFDMSFICFFHMLSTSEEFRENICKIFDNSEYKNVYWEFPGLDKNSFHLNAEFVLISTNPFPQSDTQTFLEHFNGKQELSIIKFPNLSGDTELITVCPSKTNKTFNNCCSDIMSFIKLAPKIVVHNMLKKIGLEMSNHFNSSDKKYLSTSGRGVSWLHVRICNYPKYYTFDEYKT